MILDQCDMMHKHSMNPIHVTKQLKYMSINEISSIIELQEQETCLAHADSNRFIIDWSDSIGIAFDGTIVVIAEFETFAKVPKIDDKPMCWRFNKIQPHQHDLIDEMLYLPKNNPSIFTDLDDMCSILKVDYPDHVFIDFNMLTKDQVMTLRDNKVIEEINKHCFVPSSEDGREQCLKMYYNA